MGIPGADENTPPPTEETTTNKIFGTFSAAAAASLAVGGGVRPEVALMQRQAELVKDAQRIAMRQEKLLEKIVEHTRNPVAVAG